MSMRCVPLAVRTAFAIFRLLVQRWWRRRSGTPYRGAAQYARSAFCAAQKRVAQRAIRHVAHRACASHCHARARCAGHAHEHMHACRERLTRTLHARERRRCGNYSHMATRADVKRQDAQLTGHWLTVGRLADGTSGANTLCNHARHLQCSRGTCITHTMCLL